jgi:hypothetical protein
MPPSADQAKHEQERDLSNDADDKDQSKRASDLTGPAQLDKASPAKPEITSQKSTAESKRERFTKKLEGFSPVFEFAVAAAAIVGVLLVIIQIYYLGKSDRLSRKSLQLTRENNAASDITTRKILEKMQESNRITREALTASKNLSDAASRANKLAEERAATDQWSAVATASREERFFRVAHRARLGNVTVDKIELQPGRDMEVRANYRNDPASLPAEHVIAKSNTWAAIWDDPLPKTLTFIPPLLGETPEIVVGPGGTPYTTAVWKAPEPIIGLIKERRLRWYFFGRITYTDALKTKGLLEFCFFYYPPTNDWAYCKDHNIVR